MPLIDLKTLDLPDVRQIYKVHLMSKELSHNTVQTAISDAFYIWRKMDKQAFWDVLEANDFEQRGTDALGRILPKQKDGLPNKNISAYMSQLRRFRSFALSEYALDNEPTEKKVRKYRYGLLFRITEKV